MTTIIPDTHNEVESQGAGGVGEQLAPPIQHPNSHTTGGGAPTTPHTHISTASHARHGVGGQLAPPNEQTESQRSLGGATNPPDTQTDFDSQIANGVGGQLAPPKNPTESHIATGGAPTTPHTQSGFDSQEENGVGGQATETAQRSRDSHDVAGGFGSDQPAAQRMPDSQEGSGGGPLLVDPTLEMAADIVDDLERVRTANENRLRQLTDTGELGHGLTLDNADVKRLAALVESLKAAEHQAVLNLGRLMRRHPLGEFIKQRSGLGEKQTARLLAAIRDPYWNDLHDRPRTLRELNAFCGMHVLGGIAPARRRGERINWSPDARMRIWLIADKCIQIRNSPYRKVYDDGRLKYADAVHKYPCAQCGPKNNPAQPGSALSAGHQHSRARRLIAKAILKDLWQAAKNIHTAQNYGDSQVHSGGVDSSGPSSTPKPNPIATDSAVSGVAS